MKILWFTNTASLAEGKLLNKPTGGGWIKSLERSIQKKLELSIAFYHNEKIKSFKYGATNYYPIYNKRKSGLNRLLNIFTTVLEPETDEARYLDIIKIVNPDIIHIHGTESPFGKLIGKTNIPIIISIQGNLTVYHYKYFTGLPCKLSKKYFGIKNTILRKSYYRDYKHYEKMAKRERAILKKAKFVIGRTDWDRRITSVLAPNSKYFHNNEILRKQFYNKSWIAPKNERIIIHTTTGTNYYKGFETIYKAVKILESLNFIFLWRIAGISPTDRIVELVKSKFQDKHLPKSIKFLGKLNEKELISSMIQSNLYVMPSHIENSPNSLCEAMLLGMPCIATYAGGTSSLLENNKEGLLVQDGDPWSMSGAIKELCKSPSKMNLMGEKARKRAMERHEPNKIVNDLLNIYSRILNKNVNK